MRSHLLGKCYLGFICPRRMPAKVLEPSRALIHNKKQFFFLLMNMLMILRINSALFLLHLNLFSFLALLVHSNDPLYFCPISSKVSPLWVHPIISNYFLAISQYAKRTIFLKLEVTKRVFYKNSHLRCEVTHLNPPNNTNTNNFPPLFITYKDAENELVSRL